MRTIGIWFKTNDITISFALQLYFITTTIHVLKYNVVAIFFILYRSLKVFLTIAFMVHILKFLKKSLYHHFFHIFTDLEYDFMKIDSVIKW